MAENLGDVRLLAFAKWLEAEREVVFARVGYAGDLHDAGLSGEDLIADFRRHEDAIAAAERAGPRNEKGATA